MKIKQLLISILPILVLISCGVSDNDKLDSKSFRVESLQDGVYLDFKTPKTYLDVYEEYFEDTTKEIPSGVEPAVRAQNRVPDSYVFYDSITPSNFITVLSMERFILTKEPPKATYFAQRSGRFYDIFPRADSIRTIVYEWRNKKYRDLRYHKTLYKLNSNGYKYYQAIYFIITQQQTAIVSTYSKDDLNLDLYVLNMDVKLEGYQ